jgi:hypothetical protein
MSREEQVRLAAHAWNYALHLCIHTLPMGPEREAVIACMERPTWHNVRAVLTMGRNRPWVKLIESALVEIGTPAAESILMEAARDHCR